MYGGQEGARRGPAIIAGGSEQAWESVRPVFEKISARIAKPGKEELLCCDWAGPGGAGHFVKTVHDGIAYGELQILCEAYHLMKERLGLTPESTAEAFREWNWGKTKSHLIEITAGILVLPDSDGQPLVEKILDTAGRKGNGRRAAEAALDLGVPATVLHAALDARLLSAMKAERAAASKRLGGPLPRPAGEAKPFLANMADAVFAARVINHAQGFAVLRAAGRARGWKLDPAEIARFWNGGSILRSDLMEKIDEAHRRNADLENILMDPYFGVHVEMAQPAWRRVLAEGAGCGIPLPAISAALAFYDGYRRERLPANLLQAQRDCLGAHAYERTDRPRGEFFHTDWTGEGGKATATIYSE
jgi:6-phosphogluconate dehydrogenase